MNKFEFITYNDNLGVTVVENVFINHFLPQAPSKYVKVYLYGLKCVQNRLDEMPSNRKLADILSTEEEPLKEKDVLDAFKYWHEKNIITVIHEGKRNYTIQYKNISTMLFSPDKFKANKPYSDEVIEHNSKKQRMIEALSMEFSKAREEGGFGRPINQIETEMLLSWTEDYGFSIEAVRFIVEYCMKKGKKHKNYWNAVAADIFSRNLHTFDEISNHLIKQDKEQSERYNIYNKIFNYLGLKNRGSGISKPEKKLIDKWVDDYKLSLEDIFVACDKTIATNKPNLSYVNGVIEGIYLGKDKKQNNRINTPMTTKKKPIELENESNYEFYSEDEIERAMSDD